MDARSHRETPKAVAVFHEYCLLGRERSLAKLAQKLGKPSAYTRCLETWSSQHHWQERVRQYDAEQARAQDEAIAAEREKILKKDFALIHKRIELLGEIVEQLNGMRHDEEKVWVPDVKSIGAGPSAIRVDLVQFNDALFRELRAALTDIAAEMGERVKTTKQEVSGQLDITGAKDSLLQKLRSLDTNGDEESHFHGGD